MTPKACIAQHLHRKGNITPSPPCCPFMVLRYPNMVLYRTGKSTSQRISFQRPIKKFQYLERIFSHHK